MSLPQEIRQLWESYLGRGVLGQMISNPLGNLAAATFEIFTVAGGNILITCLYGMCIADEGGGAITARFHVNATAGGLSYLSAASAITAVNATDIITAQGDPALPTTPTADSGAGPSMWHPWICKPGTIGLTINAATGTSDWIWNLIYVPLDEGVTVVIV